METNSASATCVISTGGTVDKLYSPLTGGVGFADNSHVQMMLAEGRCALDRFTFRTVFLKDSLDLTPEDRDAIRDSCRAAPESRIVVLHGTDTMCETGRHLVTAELGKTIVLTGAFVPWSMARSDAAFNLGSAVTAAQILPPGVYIVINGRVFPAARARKDRERGTFEEVAESGARAEP